MEIPLTASSVSKSKLKVHMLETLDNDNNFSNSTCNQEMAVESLQCQILVDISTHAVRLSIRCIAFHRLALSVHKELCEIPLDCVN